LLLLGNDLEATAQTKERSPYLMTADKEKVVIIDFGGQYTQLIARRVRELKVYSEIVPFTASLDEVKKMEPSALIFSGGAASVYGEGAPSYDPAVYNLGIPILGICYGMQLMAKQLGGIVTPAERAEYGKISLHLKGQSPLFLESLKFRRLF